MMGIATAISTEFTPGDIAVPASVYVNPDLDPENNGECVL